MAVGLEVGCAGVLSIQRMLLLLLGGPLLSRDQRLWLPSGGPLSGVGLPEAAGNQGHSPGHLVLFKVGPLEPSFHGQSPLCELDLRAAMPWVAPEEERGGGAVLARGPCSGLGLP